MIKTIASRIGAFFKSFQLTIVLLVLLMCLVVLCTLAQVEMGTQGAVNAYMRSFIVRRQFSGLPFPIPVFPGGALVGLLLTLNLIAKTLDIKLSWQKAGIWLVHCGLVILFAGEFVAGMMQVDTNMSIEVGQTVILGWSPQIFTMLSELTLANENQRHATIVVLADRDKVEMEDQIRERVAPSRRVRRFAPRWRRCPSAPRPRDSRSSWIATPGKPTASWS